MEMFSSKFLIAVFLFITLFVNEGNAKNYQLFSRGKSTYCIIVSKDATESELYAARELQTYLSKIGSIVIPIKYCGEGLKGKRIIVGYNSDVKRLLPEVTKPMPDDEAFFYKNSDGDIVILGGCERGTMYGVFAFLENEFGIRWYTETSTVVPQRRSYSFSCLQFSDAPAISVRNMMYSEIRDKEFRVHNRLNGRIRTAPYKPWFQQGGGYTSLEGHTLSFIMPVDEYFKSHPEYFALRNGKRNGEKTQPCFSNPDVLRVCTNNLLKIMRERPEFNSYAVSAFDNSENCECVKCKAAISRMGSYTDLVLDFVNKIAKSVESEFPDKKLQYSAYRSTRQPPLSVKPRHNVSVSISTIEPCHVHGFEHCNSEDAKQITKELMEWRKISNEIDIWDYACDFSAFNIPFPNFYALQANLKFYQKLGIKNIVFEGNHYTYNGEFQALRIYLLARLLWNPDCDIDAVVDDFLQGYFGSSAPYIRQYFDLIHSRVMTNTHLTVYTSYRDKFYDDILIQDALKIFKKAKLVADNAEILRRVELEELSVCLLSTLRNPKKAISDGTYIQTKRVIEKENIDLRKENLKKIWDQINR